MLTTRQPHSRRDLLSVSFLLAFLVSGCSGHLRSPLLFLTQPADSTTLSLEDWLRRHPVSPGQPVRADVLMATAALSSHIVQVVDRERPHRHDRHDATVVLLEGEGTLHAAGRDHPMRTGDTFVMERGTPHHFRNTGRRPAIAFVTFVPPYDGSDQVFLDR